MSGGRRHALAKRLKLGGLALLGLCAVSIPLTAAVVLSATGASDVLTLGDVAPRRPHALPTAAAPASRCVAERGYYALTFDDGPLPDTTPRLVAALRRAKAVATFFDIGERAAAAPQLVELQGTVGAVANHSYSHPRLPEVSQERRLQELQTAAKVLGYPNTLFRPPYGETSRSTDADIARSGLTAVYWTVDAEDTRAAVGEIVERALLVRPGGIILLHDGVDRTIAAIPAIVDGLRRRGMCPGAIVPAAGTTVGANGRPFHATAVKP